MAQPNSSDRIISTPANTGQPYDATSTAPMDAWKSMDPNSGPADIHTGRVTGDFADGAPWGQV